MKTDYIPKRNGDLDTWEDNFLTEIDVIAAALAVPVLETAALKTAIAEHRARVAKDQDNARRDQANNSHNLFMRRVR